MNHRDTYLKKKKNWVENPYGKFENIFLIEKKKFHSKIN